MTDPQPPEPEPKPKPSIETSEELLEHQMTVYDFPEVFERPEERRKREVGAVIAARRNLAAVYGHRLVRA